MVIVVGKFAEGAWMVVIAIPLLVWLLLRIQHTYGREVAQRKVQASQRLAPPKPRHEVVELVDAPDRNLLATVEEAVAERVRPDTEVTVLVPRRRYVGFWRRVLHDQTSAGLTRVLGGMPNVNVTIVPFHLGSQPPLAAVRET
jgi:hypothetical protein